MVTFALGKRAQAERRTETARRYQLRPWLTTLNRGTSQAFMMDQDQSPFVRRLWFGKACRGGPINYSDAGLGDLVP